MTDSRNNSDEATPEAVSSSEDSANSSRERVRQRLAKLWGCDPGLIKFADDPGEDSTPMIYIRNITGKPSSGPVKNKKSGLGGTPKA